MKGKSNWTKKSRLWTFVLVFPSAANEGASCSLLQQTPKPYFNKLPPPSSTAAISPLPPPLIRPFHYLKNGVTHTDPLGLSQTDPIGVTQTVFEAVEVSKKRLWKQRKGGSGRSCFEAVEDPLCPLAVGFPCCFVSILCVKGKNPPSNLVKMKRKRNFAVAKCQQIAVFTNKK